MKPFTQEHKDNISKAMKGRKRKPFSKEHRMRLSQSKMGENHPLWKGDNVSYGKLHDWLRRNMPPPKDCHRCGKITDLDCANITGIYTREFKNWAYLCKLCHYHFDGGRSRDLLNGRFVKKFTV